jgi:hypothetical protein
MMMILKLSTTDRRWHTNSEPDLSPLWSSGPEEDRAFRFVLELFPRFLRASASGAVAGGPEFVDKMIKEGYGRPDDAIRRAQLRTVTDYLLEHDLNDMTQLSAALSHIGELRQKDCPHRPKSQAAHERTSASCQL